MKKPSVQVKTIEEKEARKIFKRQGNRLMRERRWMIRFEERVRRAAIKGEKYIFIRHKYEHLFNPSVFENAE
jgi:hypothetical protein